MQILYWHLRRPTRSSFGGQVHSPPLLQRPTAGVNIDAFTNLLEELELEEDMEMQDGNIMEVDENGDTVFYFNVENFIEDPDGEQTELGQQDFESVQYATQVEEDEIQYSQQNGLPEDETGRFQDGFEEESDLTTTCTSTSSVHGQFSHANGTTGNKRKGNYGILANKDRDGDDSEDDESGIDFREPVVTKRPKLVINLYEDERGYEIGCILPSNNGNTEVSQISHLIQYSEDSILKSIDREEIPDKLMTDDREECHWNRGHVLAQIRDFRRHTTTTTTGISGSNSSNNKTTNFRPAQKISAAPTHPPVIREVVLRPTTQSILTDFDRLIDKSIRDRQRWKKVVNKSGSQPYNNNNNNSNHYVSDDSDSEYEFEVDFPSSLSQESDQLSYEQRLELEKEFVNRSAGSLCLDPSPVVGLINNRIQYERLKWRGLKPKKQTKAIETENEADGEPNSGLSAFSTFVNGVKDRLGSIKDPEPLKLPMIPCLNYPSLDPPTNFEEIIKMGPKPEPCALRTLHIDNYVKRIEEYTLETERRKRPHTTKLSIFQRNGMDCYFGELEMESILDSPSITTKPGVKEAYATTKCQFELGSSRSVALYVKQFSDIFTEDGRRPCKITYQKVGQPLPQILYTNSYKLPTTPTGQQQPTPGSSPVSTTTTTTTINGTPATSNTNLNQSSSSSNAPPVPSQPPVQIVHPQPRSIQQTVATDSVTVAQSQIYSSAGNQNQNQPVASVSPSVNFNLSVNSVAGGATTTTPQQILTRPQIVSLNLQSQQQTVAGVQGQGGVRATTAQQQLLQQRLLRLKQIQQAQQQAAQQQQQQQAQQQQQPTTALAKLLLTNIQQTTGSRPITVAVQPQPQTPNKNSSAVEAQQQQQLTVNPSALMISSQGVGQQNSTQNLNVNVNSSPGLSVNLNSMMLDGLLSGGTSSINVGNGNVGVGPNLISSTNLRVAGGGGGSNTVTAQGNLPGTVNILRVNNTATNNGNGLSTGAQQSLQRQLSMNAAVSNMSTGHNLILQQSHHPQQRILINANGGQQIGSVTVGGGNSEVEELSVPDLNSLLNAAAVNGSTVQLGGQTQTIMTASNSGLTQMTAQTPTVDTHNLNLNLNVNLNSGTVMSSGDSSHSQLQTTGQGPPPFLVFISPLRSVPVSISTSTGLNRQVTTLPTVVSSASTLSLNLGSIQSLQQQQVNSSHMDSVVTTSLASTNNLMTALSNNNNVMVSSQNVSSSGEVNDGVDSIFNALSEAIGPDFGQKLDGIGNQNTVMIGNTPYTVSVSSSGNTELNPQPQPQISPSMSNSNNSGGGGVGSHKKDSSIITLSDLLGSSSSSMSSSTTTTITNPSGLSSLILNSGGGVGVSQGSPSIMASSPQNSISSSSSSGSVLSSTPRLSALLAGTPSADSSSMSSTRISAGSPLSSPTSLSDSSSGGTLLDRLAASLTHNNNNSYNSNQPHQPQRTSGSGLNPIASATPNVVLEHPVLAATLTGQQSPRGVSAYRQIAPAPTSSLMNRKHH